MMNNLEIKKAEVKDFPEIAEVWEASVRATHHFLSEEDILFYKPLILNKYLSSVELFYVKDEEDNIIAFVGISGKKIEMLFIHPDYRRKGIGKYLFEFAKNKFGVIFVDVNEQNEQAVKFYRNQGFRVINRKPLDDMGKPFPILGMILLDNYFIKR